MAQNLNKTKRRISSINATKKITKAMELVSTVKLRRYKNVMLENSLYTEEIVSLTNLLLSSIDKGEKDENVYLKSNDAELTLYIVVSSNLGLCAGFNNDVFHFVKNNVDKNKSLIIPIGIKGCEFLEREGYKIDDRFVKINEKLIYSSLSHLADFVRNAFINKEYKEIKLIYTHYVNSIKFVPTSLTIFPLSRPNDVDELSYPPIYDPDPKDLINQFIPLYTSALLYERLLESEVSEQASRRMAMESANDNADELISKLTLEYNKARQATITQEISEVISSQLN